MLLRVSNVHFKYPDGTEALHGAELEADVGEVIAVTGPNGCGKTTLLMVAAGLIEPDEGTVVLNGRPLREQLPEARRYIGFLFQNPDDQLFNATVRDEIAFALRQLGLSAAEVSERVREVAAEFGVEDLLDKPPYRLSLGEKKRVALASVVVYDPQLLLLDEPTANLPPRAIGDIERLLEGWRAAGKAAVVASHNVDFVARVADRVYLMNSGRVVRKGAAREVLRDEEALERADLSLPTPAKIAKLLGHADGSLPTTMEELVDLLSGS